MQQKIKFFENNTLKLTRYYFGSYEKEIDSLGNVMHIDYIYTPTGLTAIWRSNSPPEGELEGVLYYVLKDNMKSVQVITDTAGNIVNEWYYSPWGARTRIDGTEFADITDRGYTGHEHLTALGLINMNGRIYDPVLARFLSPDPYVQAPDFSQGFNRYAYCLNNPFKYSDPSGEVFVIDDFIAAIAISAIVTTAVNIFTNNIHSATDFFLSIGIGAAAGAAGYLAGVGISAVVSGLNIIAQNVIVNSVSSAIGGFVGSAGSAWGNGASFGEIMLAGLKGAGIGALIGGITGGIRGGIHSKMNGGSFWHAGKTSAYVQSSGVYASDEIFSYEYTDIDYAEDTHLLKNKVKNMYNVKEGDMGIRPITAKADLEEVVLAGDMSYFNTKTKENWLGYVNQHKFLNQRSMCISPKVINGDIVDFEAIVSHELTHAYHYYALGARFNKTNSEKAAYKSTYDIYWQNGKYISAIEFYNKAVQLGYWGAFPNEYKVPLWYKFSTTFRFW